MTLQHFQSDYCKTVRIFSHIARKVSNVGTFWFHVAKGGRGLTDGGKFEAASWSVGGPSEIFQCPSFLLSFVPVSEVVTLHSVVLVVGGGGRKSAVDRGS